MEYQNLYKTGNILVHLHFLIINLILSIIHILLPSNLESSMANLPLFGIYLVSKVTIIMITEYSINLYRHILASMRY